MINESDVVKMRVPFPSVDSELAVQSHMYICLKNGDSKEFLKCQTFKPTHLLPSSPPFRYIKEIPDLARNPFRRMTTIDCDKSFCIEDVIISTDLLTESRRDVCDELFNEIQNVIDFPEFTKERLDSSLLSSINSKISTPV